MRHALLSTLLEHHHFASAVSRIRDANAALLKAAAAPDLILIDTRLPDGSGLDACRSWRAKGLARDSWIVCIANDGAPLRDGRWAEAGADICLPKRQVEGNPDALVTALSRRLNHGRFYELGRLPAIQLDAARRVVIAGDTESSQLSHREYEFVRTILDSPSLVPRRVILSKIVSPARGECANRALTYFFRHLRPKLPRPLRDAIVCERGLGYRLAVTR